MDDSTLDIRTLFGVLRRQLRLMLVTVLVVMTVAAIVIFSLKPVYTASALVLVNTSQKNLLDPTEQLLGGGSDSARVDSEVELAKSETVLLRVVDDAKLLQDSEFAPEPGWTSRLLSFLRLREYAPPTGADLLDATLSRLRDAVTVQRRGLTFLIAVQARSANPEEAAKLANAVAKTYIAEQLEAKIDSTLSSRDIIQARILDAGISVANSEDALDNFIGDNIGAIATETARPDLKTTFEQIGSAASARTQLASLVEAADTSLRRRDWSALTKSLQSEALASLADKREQVASLLASAGADSEQAIDLRRELAQIDTDLESSANSALTSLQQQVTGAQTRVTELKSQLRSDVLASNLSSSTLTRLYEFQQNAEIARSQYQTLLTRSKDLEQQAYLQVADSRVASEALPPSGPSFPNPRLLFLLAGLFAVALAVGLAFLYENFIGGVVSADQMRGLVRASNVLVVPRQREDRSNLSVADNLVKAPLSVFSESVRKIRVAVDQSIRRRGVVEGRGSVVLISSAVPGEGKTTMALSLARAYALSGKTTLLIDCDLRKPSVHRQLGIEPATGLLDYLSQSEHPPALGSIVSLDHASAVGVLVGSRRSDRATDQLIAGSAFKRLVEAATKAFEVVVLDTPPIGPVVDGVYLAQFADAIVFIARWASTSQPEVKSAATSLLDGAPQGVEVIGVVNQSADGRGSYSGKYAYYYSEA